MKKAPVVVSSKANANSLRIYLGGHLHLFLRREQVAGLQAWQESGKWPFKIEVSTPHGDPIFLEYDNRQNWVHVLAEIDKSVAKWR